MKVRCLICNAPGAFLCGTKHADDESDRANLGRVLEWERGAREGASVTDAERLALTELAADLRALRLSPVAILMRSLLATKALVGKTDAEVLASIEAPGEIDPVFAPTVLRTLADLRRAGVPRSPVRHVSGSPEVDLAEEVPLLANLADGDGAAKDLRRLVAAIGLGKRRPRQRLAADFNRDVWALRVGKRVQEVLEAAHRAAPKTAKTPEALTPYLKAAGANACVDRLADDLASFRRERWATLREFAALFLLDARAGQTAPRSAAPSERTLQLAEAELRRLEKLPLTVALVSGNGLRQSGLQPSRDADATTRPHEENRRENRSDGREAHVDRGPRRGPSRQVGDRPTHEVGRERPEVHPKRKASLVRPTGRPGVARRPEEDLDVRPRPGRVTKAKRRPPP